MQILLPGAAARNLQIFWTFFSGQCHRGLLSASLPSLNLAHFCIFKGLLLPNKLLERNFVIPHSIPLPDWIGQVEGLIELGNACCQAHAPQLDINESSGFGLFCPRKSGRAMARQIEGAPQKVGGHLANWI